MICMDDEKPVVFIIGGNIVGNLDFQAKNRAHRAFEKTDCVIHYYDICEPLEKIDDSIYKMLEDKKSFLEKFGVSSEYLHSSLQEVKKSDVVTMKAEKIQRLDNLRKKLNKRWKKKG